LDGAELRPIPRFLSASTSKELDMSSTQARSETVEKLEVAVIPVADIDRAKRLATP
jgi:hypothetical protein